MWLKFVKDAIECITSTQNPITIHFNTARKILKEKYNIEDEGAVALLASSLLENCQKVKRFKSFKHPAFKINSIEIQINYLDDHICNEKEDILSLDADFIRFIKQFGKKGKECAKIIEDDGKRFYDYYKKNNFPSSYRREVWGLWIPLKNDQGQNEIYNGFLRILALVFTYTL